MFDPSLLTHQPSRSDCPVSNNRANISDVLRNELPSMALNVSDELDDDESEGDGPFHSLLDDLSQGKLTFSFNLLLRCSNCMSACVQVCQVCH